MARSFSHHCIAATALYRAALGFRRRSVGREHAPGLETGLQRIRGAAAEKCFDQDESYLRLVQGRSPTDQAEKDEQTRALLEQVARCKEHQRSWNMLRAA